MCGFKNAEFTEMFGNVKKAAEEMGIEERVTRLDMKDAVKYGITLFPALIVDGKLVAEGRVLPVKELIRLIEKA